LFREVRAWESCGFLRGFLSIERIVPVGQSVCGLVPLRAARQPALRGCFGPERAIAYNI
jgi:hypothetical protein